MRPPRSREVPLVKYRYADLVECEEAGDHRVTPMTWPPPKTATMTADPHLSMQCELCGAWLIVYAGHATGALQGITVVLPERVKQPA